MSERVAVVGSRDFGDWNAVRAFIRTLPAGTTVVSGAARGVDSVAAECARACKLAVLEFPADWVEYGRSAGFRRNQQIVDAADRVVAFWDGQSKGTAHTIELAKKAGKPVEIIR